MPATSFADPASSAYVLPAQACDAHLHLYDNTIIDAPPASSLLAACTVSRYRALRDSLGLQRAVVVTPAPHKADNRVTLAAIAALSPTDTRGVGVVFPEVSDAELAHLHAGGIRGIRFTVAIPATAVTRIDMIAALAPRVAKLGWHLQLHMTAAQIVENQELLLKLPAMAVFDHMARLADAGADPAAWAVVEELLCTQRAWVKLSGHYLAADAAQARTTAQRLVALAPTRLVWGSDWPHPTEMPEPPPTVSTLAALHAWVPDAAQRTRILVDNPAALYGF